MFDYIKAKKNILLELRILQMNLFAGQQYCQYQTKKNPSFEGSLDVQLYQTKENHILGFNNKNATIKHSDQTTASEWIV